MWEWLGDNAKVLTVFTSVGTMLVWIFYAQLLLAAFRRQRQARVLINQGWGIQVNSVCLVSNMSHEPIYIQCVIITLHTSSGEYSSSITDFDEQEPYDSANRPEEITRQGPLKSGCYMNLGTFRTLIRQASEQNRISRDEEDPMNDIGLKTFDITVICVYGPESKAIGIQREFFIEGKDNQRLRPASIYSRRMVSSRARRKMEHWLKEIT